jgi:hypothetical protein
MQEVGQRMEQLPRTIEIPKFETQKVLYLPPQQIDKTDSNLPVLSALPVSELSGLHCRNCPKKITAITFNPPKLIGN